MKQKTHCRHATAMLLLVVGLFVVMPQTAYGKEIDPKRATEIAKKYVSLPRGNDAKVRNKVINASINSPYYNG